MMEQKFDKVRALDDREQAREKLPVWYGSRSNYYHGFREVCLNNPIDEICNNFEKGDIFITLHDDSKTLTVKDTGRGMPINLSDDTGTPYWNLFFTKMFASGKYDLEQDNSGTNGLGGTVLNYTSELYDVISCFNGEKWHIRFKDGGLLDVPLENLGKTTEHGTEITFKLDQNCYSEEVVYDADKLKDMIDKVSSVSPTTTIHFKYKDEVISYHYDEMLKGYYIQNIESKDNLLFELNHKTYNTKTSVNSDEIAETTNVQCILSKSFAPKQLSFLNRNNLIQEGTIDVGLIEGLKYCINKYAKENNLFDKVVKQVSADDIKQSISYMIFCNSTKVEYQSQTKFSTEKQLYKQIVKNYVVEEFELLSLTMQKEFEEIVNHVIEIARVNSQFKEKKIKNSKNSLKKRISSKKLSECTSKIPSERELHIVEGDSAGGSAKNGGNKKFQSILSTKGKIPNALKTTKENILKNEEFQIFEQAIGISMLEPFNADKLKYHKIIILTDADTDGLHIRCLWTCYCWKYYRELIEQGYLYISQPPLYSITVKKTVYYMFSDKELNDKLDELKDIPKKDINIQRYKGLGEMNADQMRETTMSPSGRRLYQVKVGDIALFEKTLEDLMGDNSEPRKEFYRNNIDKAHLIN